MRRPIIIGVGGFTSSVGKTTLVCELLRAFPGWEAIKTTRGHYRSCGKDAHSCCVSHLLSEEPLVRSGRAETYSPGKDTGRYWDAGAANVHWLIATKGQIERGIRAALDRVQSEGVFVEGNSFSQFVSVDYFIMVKRGNSDEIKSSATRVLDSASAIYLSSDDEGLDGEGISASEQIGRLTLPVFKPQQVRALLEELRKACERHQNLAA